MCALVAVLAACGGARQTGEAPASRPSASATATKKSAATAPASTSPSHDLYAANGFTCDACHPCGTKSATGHDASWMDQTSTGFHAYAADSGIASCQACHGAALDGVGGTVSVSCAQCHGATWKTTCTMCHGGTDNQTGAPPRTVWGQSADVVRVGAHTAHVGATHGLSGPIDCAVCHPKPTDALTPGHANGATADVTFTGLAAQAVATPPTWNRTAATCASTYCHGGTLGGGAQTTPIWTQLDGSQRTCGSCHGAPPPSPHPSNSNCGQCHPGYTATSVAVATHIDGKVDVINLTCTSCHGTTGVNAAPPLGTHGETATTALAVGAHQVHLTGGALSGPIACAECHVVPTSTTHANGVVTVTFGALSTTSGATPSWNPTTATCASVYCHGQFVGGSLLNAPSWTTVNGSQDACGSCHGVPPAAPHVQNSQCGNCHPGYTATTVNLASHVNGAVDVVALTCTSCHGTAGVNAAPPLGTRGETATTARAVGAHQTHLAGGASKPVACGECHVVPTSMTHANGTVALTWGPTATAGGAVPQWNGATCASTYCHGATLNAGGTLHTPSWTIVNGTQAACGTCHGDPPPAPHVQNTACGSCHPGYTNTTVNAATHVDGKVDVITLTCSSCHGDTTRTAIAGADANELAAPPSDSKGNTAVSARGVGVHVAHVNQSTYRAAPIACSECHFNAVPTTMTHANGTVQFAFGALATNASWGGVTPAPAWNGTTCASTYCHGAFKNGATATMTWTTPGALGCTSCHGAPPTGNGHPSNPSCGNCHTGYTATTVNKALHMNGALDVIALTCSSCHGDATRTAIAGADANETAAPPADSHGNTATTARGVGVHVAHVNQATYRAAPIACSECHFNAVPTTMNHSNGTVQFAFGTLATNASWGGVTPAPAWNGTTCASTYCHGAFKNGATATMTWTAPGALSCASCHGAPPGGSHPANASCGNCHSGYTSTSVNKSLHMNGALDVTLTCTSCHGTAGQTATAASPLYAAPPVDSLGAATGLRVGAHQKHLSGSAAAKTYSNGFACQTCHASVGTYTTSHANGTADVGFTGATPATVAIGSYTPRSGTTAGSCASTWCHAVKSRSGYSSGGTLQTPSWNGAITACTACHGLPPSTGQHQRSEHIYAGCGACHASYSSTAVNKTLHVNGVRDVGGTGTRINSWNTSTHTCSPSCHGTQTW